MPTVPRSLTLLAVFLSLVLGACGGSDEPAAPAATPAGPNGIDMGFAAEMGPHHQEAVAMARLADERGRHPEIERLAADIVKSQKREIRVLDRAFQRLSEQGLQSEALGIPVEMMGMGHDTQALADSRPFDREFIDAMVPHHQGAIRMARVELAKGGDEDLKALAQDIIDTQSREIEQMNEWRTEWYDAPSPAGGIPPEVEDLSEKGHTDEPGAPDDHTH
jgi:uncharacterized protein (DUF305 family)